MSNLDRAATGFEAEFNVADWSRKAYEKAAVRTAVKNERVPLFEPEGSLFLTFGMLSDYREVRKQIASAARRKSDDPGRELAVALETLKMASTGGYILCTVDGEEKRAQLVDANRQPVTLGLAMHNALFPEGRADVDHSVTVKPLNDNEAIYDLFYRIGDLGVMNMGTRVDLWITAGGPSEDDDEAEDAVSNDEAAMEVALGES